MLLLNKPVTVAEGQALSCSKFGWEKSTTGRIRRLCQLTTLCKIGVRQESSERLVGQLRVTRAPNYTFLYLRALYILPVLVHVRILTKACSGGSP